MIPIYAIINEKERNDFEKKYQIPYGYGLCEFFYDYDTAYEFFDEEKIDYHESFVIEKVDSNGREIIYRK